MQILDKKKILISDPRVQDMTELQWAAEMAQYEVSHNTKYEEIEQIFESAKAVLASYLGLNIVPVQDEQTGLYRMPDTNEIMPLSFFVARRELLQDVSEKLEALENQETLNVIDGEVTLDEDMTPEELDAMFESDLDFFDDEESLRKFVGWESPEAQQLRKQLIEIVDETTLEKELESLEDRPKNVVKSRKPPKIVIDD